LFFNLRDVFGFIIGEVVSEKCVFEISNSAFFLRAGGFGKHLSPTSDMKKLFLRNSTNVKNLFT
jgi:hypothetical protein